MASLNQVQLIGNLTADPEIKVAASSGKKFAKFSVATSREWKDSNGEKQSVSEFHNIIAWDKLADILERYVQKGKQVYVEGRLSTSTWEDKDSGKKMYRTEIIANQVLMLGKKEAESKEVSFDDAIAAAPSSKDLEAGRPDIADVPF